MMTLSLVIPVYNETARLPQTIEALASLRLPHLFQVTEIIFVNDGSTDSTLPLLKETKEYLAKATKAKIIIISYPRNKGKGYAVKTGMLRAKSEYVLLTDADLSTPLSQLHRFRPAIKKAIPVIIGTRKTSQAKITKAQPIYRQFMGRIFTFLSNLILNTWVTDFTCGFKLFHQSSIESIFSRARIDRWGYDAEILFIARKSGVKISEYPVEWHNDERTKVNVLRAAFQSLLELIQIRHNEWKGLYNFESNTFLSKFYKALI